MKKEKVLKTVVLFATLIFSSELLFASKIPVTSVGRSVNRMASKKDTKNEKKAKKSKSKEKEKPKSTYKKKAKWDERPVNKFYFDDYDFENQRPLPVLVEHELLLRINGIRELSGICLSKDEDFLWAVEDNGGLYRIDFDGAFSLEWKKQGEMEDLALNSENGNLYIGLESPSKSAYEILFNGSKYNFKKDSKPLFAVEGAESFFNNGVEGITCYNGDLYFGVQTNALLYKYSMGGELKSKKSLCDVENCDISEIAGLDYDKENDYLWVLDSENFTIYLFNGEASVLYATYYIRADANSNPEGICVDKKRGCIWVCEDMEGKALIHKFKFENL